MSFNFSHKNEYSLHNSMIRECIKLYGFNVKLVKTEKLNSDKEVFGDWSSVKTNNTDVFDINMLPENSEAFDNSEYNFGDFGFLSQDTCNAFVSAEDCLKLGFDSNSLMSCLIVLPSNKVMEITNVDIQSPHINNLWAYSDAKCVFKLSLNTYNFKLHDEIEHKDVVNTLEVNTNNICDLPDEVSTEIDNTDTLDNYFEHLIKQKNDQDYEADVRPAVTVVKKSEYSDEIDDMNSSRTVKNSRNKDPSIDDTIKSAIVNKSELDPFGW